MTQTKLIDLACVLRQIQTEPAERRLNAFLRQAGCSFSETDDRVLTDSSVSLWAIGGMAFCDLAQAGIEPLSAARLSTSSMGCVGAMSYLSLPGGSPLAAFDKIAGEHHHYSIAHAVTVSLVVAGCTCAVENEFNSQRDLAHLARITVARTAAQEQPALCALEPYMVEHCSQALATIDQLVRQARSTRSKTGGDEREAINLLYPANKASGFVITASLRNFQKLLGAIDDEGKEKEYRRLLQKIKAQLATLWPTLFE